MSSNKQSPEPLKIEPALLTVEQTCQLINVKRATFYNLKASGKFAPLSVGLCRKVLYVRSEIESWIKSGCPHRKDGDEKQITLQTIPQNYPTVKPKRKNWAIIVEPAKSKRSAMAGF